MTDNPEDTGLRRWTRPFYLSVGWVSVALGIIGVFLPLLPTTPFLLVALWAFARSSPAAAAWLRGHSMLGPYIVDWQDRGVVPMRAKITAVVMMSASYAWLTLATDAPIYVKIGVGLVLAGAAAFVTTRPST